MLPTTARTKSWITFAESTPPALRFYRTKTIDLDYSARTKFVTFLSEISLEGSKLSLERPVLVSVTKKDGYTQIDCLTLNIYSAGRSYKEAMESFSEDFFFSVDEYVKSDPDFLTEDAKKLRQRLLFAIGNGKCCVHESEKDRDCAFEEGFYQAGGRSQILCSYG